MNVGAPVLEESSFFKKYCGLQRAQWTVYWQGGRTCTAIATSLAFISIFTISLYIPKLAPIPIQEYNQVSDVYPRYYPLTLEYNAVDLVASQSTEDLMGPLVAAQGGDLVASPQDWEISENESLFAELK